MKDWKKYERYVAYLCSEEYVSLDTTVIPNAKILGKYSKVNRQIDVLIEKKYDSNRERRIIVDAKRINRKIDVNNVEEFEGMMRDCGASRGVLVCPKGYSDGALRRAQNYIQIRLVSIEDLGELDFHKWEECLSNKCDNRKNRGLILWDMHFVFMRHNGLLNISCVAKCDECSSFHVWCWDCGEKFTLSDEDEHKCGCDDDWFWLTSIEEYKEPSTGNIMKSVYLSLPSFRDYIQKREPMLVDVKPLT